ncbi:MAG: hypothetical protein ACR2OC_11215 [Solirubrobacterales bacterium]
MRRPLEIAYRLAEQGLDSPAGERLLAYELQAEIMARTASTPQHALDLGHAAIEAPDGGSGMTAALLSDLPDEEREEIGLIARSRAGYACLLAAKQLVAAATVVLRADPSAIEPEVVGLVAAMPVIGQRANGGEDG